MYGKLLSDVGSIVAKRYEHLTPQERVDVYKDALNNRELPPPASIEFTDEELDVIEDASQNDLLSTVVSMSWEDRHYANCKEWEGKTGTPAESSRGFFSKHAIVLKAHLGLEVLIRHTLRTGNNTGRWSDDVWGIHAYKSTSAYLTWPGASFEENFHQRDEVFAEVSSARFFSGDELYSPTESSFAMPIALPSQLPGKSLARFARALEILDIQPEGEDEARREMLFARKRDKKAMEASVKQPTEGVEVQPQLMFLMRVDDRASPSI